jgi:hypothetical protein
VWTTQNSAGVVQVVLAGERIGVLMSNGSFLVKEGALNAGWTTQNSSQVTQTTLS